MAHGRGLLAVALVGLSFLVVACDGSGGPSVAQLVEGYDRALLELEANPNLDLREFEERFVWKYTPGSNMPVHLSLAAARYVLGTEVLRPSRNQRERIAALLFPVNPASLGADLAYYQRTIELTAAGHLSVYQAFEIVDGIARQRLARLH